MLQRKSINPGHDAPWDLGVSSHLDLLGQGDSPQLIGHDSLATGSPGFPGHQAGSGPACESTQGTCHAAVKTHQDHSHNKMPTYWVFTQSEAPRPQRRGYPKTTESQPHVTSRVITAVKTQTVNRGKYRAWPKPDVYSPGGRSGHAGQPNICLQQRGGVMAERRGWACQTGQRSVHPPGSSRG